MGDFLVVSLVASMILTIALNLALRSWRPDPTRWFPAEPEDRSRASRAAGSVDRPRPDRPPGVGQDPHVDDGRFVDDRRFEVVVPWKAMLAVSVGLTLALNLVVLLAR